MGLTLVYTVVFALVYFSQCTDGLQCYECGYTQGIEVDLPPAFFDASCKNGSTPNDSFSVTCEPEEEVCLKVHVDGKALDETDGTMTMRECMSELIIPGGCYEDSITSIGEHLNVSDHIKEIFKAFKPDTIAELCTCKNVDKCNAEENDGGEEGSGEGESSGTIFKITKPVLIMSFTFVIFIKFLNQ